MTGLNIDERYRKPGANMKRTRIYAVAMTLLLFAGAPVSAQTTPLPGAITSTVESKKPEIAFRTTWAALVAGNPDYATMETPLADAVKAQMANMKGLSDQIGAIKNLDYLGMGPAGCSYFASPMSAPL